ncbi:MAG: hypothetical protein LBI74_00740 [Synergistaceae bacterium]|jgi:hypothetical protein|nr:hypothetical protein [Synergistaceae bacterium]
MSNKKLTVLALFVITQLVFSASAFAGATYTWTGKGANSDWGNTNNWTGGTAGSVPGKVTDDIAVIPGNANVVVSPDVGSNVKWELQLLDGSSLIFVGERKLSFGTGSRINAQGDAIISGDGYISNVPIVEVAAGKTLTVDIPISGDSSKGGTGTLKLTAQNPPNKGTEPKFTVNAGTLVLSNSKLVKSNDAALTVNAGGTLLLDGDLTFAGTTNVVIGDPTARIGIPVWSEVKVTENAAFGTGTSTGGWDLIISGDLELATTNNPFPTKPKVTVTGELTVSSAPVIETLSGSGDISLQRDRELRIEPASASTSVFSGVIDGSGGLSFHPAVASTLTLTGSNTYSGGSVGTKIGGTAATLRIANSSALGTSRLGIVSKSTLIASGDITLPNTVDISANTGLEVNVPANSSLQLNGQLETEAEITKSGEGSLILNGRVATSSSNKIVVNDGILKIAKDGAADFIDLDLANARAVLELGDPNQTHEPDSADSFSVGNVSFKVKLNSDNLTTPYLTVYGRLNNTGPTRIVADVAGSYKTGDKFLVLAVDNVPSLDVSGFSVVNETGAPHPDFNVERFTSAKVSSGIALVAKNDRTVLTPVIGDPETNQLTVNISALKTHVINVPVATEAGLDRSQTSAVLNDGATDHKLTVNLGGFVVGPPASQGIVISGLPTTLAVGTYDITVNTAIASVASIVGEPAVPKTLSLVVSGLADPVAEVTGKPTETNGTIRVEGTVPAGTTVDSAAAKALLSRYGAFTVSITDGRFIVDGVANNITPTAGVRIPVTLAGRERFVVVKIRAKENPLEFTGSRTPKNWQTTLTSDERGITHFVTLIPIDVAPADINRVEDINILGTGFAISYADAEIFAEGRGATAEIPRIRATGTVTADDATITSVEYRVGINRYRQSGMNIDVLNDTRVVDNRVGGGGSSGCDAGFGVFALAAVVALRKRG